MSLLGMVLGNAAVCLASHEILRRVRSGVPSTDAVLFLVLRLLLISAAVLVTGLLGVFNAAVLGGLSALVLAGLIARGALKRIDRPLLPDFGLPLSILAGAVLVRLLVQAWFFAPSFGDVVDYHLPKVA
ncbi:MAG: hypothetical protein JO332_08055, partial [Planctomycetaceae bacterium]|nr:hypothetical protein [Planctomycetaceae bacterium]